MTKKFFFDRRLLGCNPQLGCSINDGEGGTDGADKTRLMAEVRRIASKSIAPFAFPACVIRLFLPCASTSQFPSPQAAMPLTISGRCRPIWPLFAPLEQPR